MDSSVHNIVFIFYTIVLTSINKCFSSNVPVLPSPAISSGNMAGLMMPPVPPISPGIIQNSNGYLMPGMAPVANPNLIMPGMAGMMGDGFNFVPMLPAGNLIGRPLMPQTNLIKPVIEKGIVYGEEQKSENNHKYDNKNQKEKINKYENAIGSQGQAGGKAVQEFQAEQIGKKDKSSNVGFHNAIDSAHQKSADENAYDGQKKYNKEGKSEDFTKSRKHYRKGHNKKGSKSSHSKDAAEKVETFYDEKHDEFGNINNNNNYGTYANKEGASYHGGFQNDHLNKQNAGQQGAFEKVSIKDNNKGEQGKFEQQGFNGHNQVYGTNAGLGMNAAKGLAQNNGFHMNFIKAIPFF